MKLLRSAYCFYLVFVDKNDKILKSLTKGTSCNGCFQKREWGAGKRKIKWEIEKEKLISFFFFCAIFIFLFNMQKRKFSAAITNIHLLSKTFIGKI